MPSPAATPNAKISALVFSLILAAPICAAAGFHWTPLSQQSNKGQAISRKPDGAPQNQKYSRKNQVMVRFKVRKDGSISDLHCTHLTSLSKEDLDSLKSMVKLTPLVQALPSNFPDEMDVQLSFARRSPKGSRS